MQKVHANRFLKTARLGSRIDGAGRGAHGACDAGPLRRTVESCVGPTLGFALRSYASTFMPMPCK
jgi:hypothetical protein